MNFTTLIYMALNFAIAFTTTYIVTPWIIKKCLEKDLTGIDLHKPDKPKIPKLGGLAIYMGLLAATTASGLYYNVNHKTLLGIMLSASIGALIGLVDDIFTLSKRALVTLTLLAGIPVVTFQLGSTVIYATPVGPVDLGPFFWLLVPLAFAYLTNAVNIYAGFNGLEAGLALVTSLTLGTCALMYGSTESALTLYALAGALLAFLKYNWYPAKIFPGNTGTYLIGAVYAATIIAGVIKTAGLLATLSYTINFLIRLHNKFNWTVGRTTPNGLIYTEKTEALWAIFMKKPTTEKQVVISCVVIQVIVSFLTIICVIILKGKWLV